MQLETKSLRKSINKAYLKETVNRSTFNHFKAELGQLLANIESAEKKDEHEEHFKNLLVPFLNEVGFNDYYINTSVRIDLAIHTDGKVKDPVGVLLEVKRPSNKNEMITEEDFNRKAMHEAVLYYLEQRIEEDNEDLKHIVITDTLNWFVFDAQEFERCYHRPSALKKVYKSWKTDQKVSSNKDFMYDKIAGFIDSQDTTLRGLHLDLQSFEKYLKAKEDSEPEKKLIPLFKFFSPTQLLKEPFANDSNTLNREFYRELLYILGLEETTKSNTRYIERASEDKRHPGSFIENTIRILNAEDHLSTVREPKVKYGSDRDEQLFNVALELSIIWMNRVLFLKLLEAQLYRYHRQDKKFKFLKSKTIDGYDELNKLFFQVLARREADRTEDINEKFGHIPYLNSYLFDPSPLEHQSVFISNLDDKKTLPVYSRSELKDRRGDEINTLEYLFEFLDAYDFAAEGGEEIQEERKTLINASVLGLIFEKINGYKDGSFFTPGFITEYMARETLRKAVTDKFAQHLDAEDLSFDNIYNRIGRGDTDIEKANEIVNSITICDPAVGSGHFLVSCLNELLAIKSDLGILSDQEGKLLRDVKVEVENDELIVTYSDEELFEYEVAPTWHGNQIASRKISGNRQRIQKALFHEKRNIIENCLFGVDINSNSVKICRLRLWIELLKNTYYTKRSDYRELEVLPNIDINIKTGNSLVSRFDLDSDLSSVFKDSDHSLEDYKEAVRSYKHTGDREEKHRLQKLIDEIQKNFSTTLLNNRPINQELSEARSELEKRKNINLFGEKEYTQEEIKEQEEIVKKLEKKKSDQESGAIFKQAFEWRFEFPEVLDEEGNYIGFDVIVENPPYIPLEKLSEIERDYFREKFKYVERKFETSVLFFLQSFRLGNNGSEQMFIAPLTWETGENYVKLREYIFNQISIEKIINLPFDIFEDAYVETGIFHFKVKPNGGYHIYIFDKKDEVDSLNNLDFTYIEKDLITPPDFKVVFDPLIARILNRINKGFKSLGEITISTQGLSGSRYDGKSEPDDDDFPYLEEGQAYNYQLIIDEITYTSMEEKKNLKRFYEADPKLLIRRIVNRRDRLDVGYTERKLVFKKDINPFVINDPNFLPKYVLGVMASKFISFLYVNTSSIATKDDFRQTTLTELRNLPIPKVDKERQKKIADLADQVLSQKKNDPEADTSQIEEEINQLVYELYGLNEEEIETVEERMKM